nr:MAG TPA: hypothetical protein [Caudoviricetes sp.]
MKVKATKAGYCGGYRMPGDVFEVEDGLTASWFVPLEQPEPEAEQPEPEAEQPEPEAEQPESSRRKK